MRVYASANTAIDLPDDTVSTVFCQAIHIGTGGDLAVSWDEGVTVHVLKNIADGTIYPIGARGEFLLTIMNAAGGTTATDLVALRW